MNESQEPDSALDVAGELDRLLRLARSRGASDLHLEPAPDGLSVRLRIDGVLHDLEPLPPALARPIVLRVKFLADLLTYRSDIPQEGRLSRDEIPELGDLRVSTFPTIHGERLVVRFFDPDRSQRKLEGLNFPPAVLEGLRSAVSATSGVVLLTGPAGAGKTTTLYALLAALLERGKHRPHIITVEDPVESVLKGVTQTQVNAPAGLTYAAIVRSILRQDPEVVMVGEIRDRETAEVVMQAGLTGHLVLSTLHGGDIPTVIVRLLEMGLEGYLVASALKAVLAMRLVRRLCPACRRPGPELLVHTGPRPTPLRTFEPVGCPECALTGYAGRVPLAEFARVDADLRKCILHTPESEAVSTQLQTQQMRSLLERGLDLLETGTTSLAELERVLGPVRRA